MGRRHGQIPAEPLVLRIGKVAAQRAWPQDPTVAAICFQHGDDQMPREQSRKLSTYSRLGKNCPAGRTTGGTPTRQPNTNGVVGGLL